MSNADVIVALAGLMVLGLIVWATSVFGRWVDQATDANPPAYKRKGH